MQHARVIRPPAIGATLISVDEDSVKHLSGVKVVRIKNFLAVVAEDEWTTIRVASALRAQWSDWAGLPAQDKLVETLRADPGITEQGLVTKGAPVTPRPQDAKTVTASYFLRGGRRARQCGDDMDRIPRHTRQSNHLCPLPSLAEGKSAADLSRRLGLLWHERP
jgi:hypothetical protein